MSTAVIRSFIAEDVESAAQIAAAAEAYPWTESVLRDCLKAGYHAWVLQLDEEPIGFLVVLDQLKECQLLNVVVLPEYQRRGYGRQLLLHAIEHAQAQQLSRMVLEVRAGNSAAISVYHKMGFVDVGIRKNYYPSAAGVREDAILMNLEINRRP